IDDSKSFEAKLKQGSRVLYLADNAGEVFFDLPLITWMRRRASVAYVAKSAPVQNDVTLEDIRRAGLEDELGELLTTGTATPGIDFSQASAEFKQEFNSADFIFAKGMGYYESLSELPAEGKVFYCLRAKCQPVADALGVPLNSYVAMLR
ncbi:MAG: ARMT1-like domain-containing protein, partial [Dehalococcoidia bacterium]|nr:ARMT1-like domain-containing protein [Dehalococcoidia bacterium]